MQRGGVHRQRQCIHASRSLNINFPEKRRDISSSLMPSRRALLAGPQSRYCSRKRKFPDAGDEVLVLHFCSGRYGRYVVFLITVMGTCIFYDEESWKLTCRKRDRDGHRNTDGRELIRPSPMATQERET